MFRNTIHTFMATDSRGLNKVPLNGIIQVVDANASGSLNPVAFIQLTSTTGISAGTTIQSLLNGSVGEYKDIVSVDAGGKAYNNLIPYSIGDITTQPQGSVPETFLTYVCLEDSNPGAFNPLKWKNLAEDLEIAGTKWHQDKNYKRGTIVSQVAVADLLSFESYVALEDNTGINPAEPRLPTGPHIWKLLAAEYFVGTFMPVPGTQYPVITTDPISAGVSPRFLGYPGAYWIINGLTPYGHVISVPNSTLLGKTVYNGDKLIWNGYAGDDLSNFDDLWELEQSNTKRSSNVFDEEENYVRGALVTYSNTIYIAHSAIFAGAGVPTINSNWHLFGQSGGSGGLLPGGTTGQLLEFTGTQWEGVAKFGINELSDVTTANPVTGDTLQYDGVGWVNSNTTAVAYTIKLSDLEDVPNTPLTDTESIRWNNTLSTWEFYSPVYNLNDVLDVDTINSVTGDTLQYNGVDWINSDTATIASTIKLSDLEDVASTPLTDTESIRWNNTIGTWEFYSPVYKLDDVLDVDTTTTPTVTDDVLQYNGSDWINVKGADILGTGSLNDIKDVQAPAILDDILQYNGTDWVNTPAGSIVDSINLTDIQDIPDSPSDSESIKWNNSLSTWEFYTPVINLGDADDVTTANPVIGDTLQYDGTKWINVTPDTLLRSGFIGSLHDVDTTGATTGDVLSYDGSLLNWKSVTPLTPSGKEWTPVDNYLKGDVVSQNGVIFTAILDNSNKDPIDNTAPFDYDLVNWKPAGAQGVAVADSTGADAAANATTINELLASLRTAGIILT